MGALFSKPKSVDPTSTDKKMATVKRAALICIDGWGVRTESHGNAILQAATPIMDGFRDGSEANWGVVAAHGLAVGLPDGVMGNSEVGHLTIGAGQVEYQDLVRINLCISDGKLPSVPNLVAAFESAKKGSGKLHLFGLLSDGGVHSHIDHLFCILDAAKAAGVPRVLLHMCLDGRDVGPTTGPTYVAQLEKKVADLGLGEISTISGRYYAMDRDKRWERVQLAYDAMCRADGQCEKPEGTLADFVTAKHAAGETDEFVKPVGVLADGGIADGDTFLCYNYRSDRAREMFEAISTEPAFETAVKRTPAQCFSFTQYSSAFTSPQIFPPQKLKNGLSEWISGQGLTQYHVAETEKYAHVTFFFNGAQPVARASR